MEEENRNRPQSQLRGYVIITLPPKDNPSYGKTITAFTISDDYPHQTATIPQVNPPQNRRPQTQSTSTNRTLLRNTQRTVFSILGLSLIALYIWAAVAQEGKFVLGEGNGTDENDDRERNKTQNTFVFPLYQKYSRFDGNLDGDVELKLGKFVRLDSIRRRSGKVDPGLAYTTSKIDDTSVIPVGGNIYPDGMYYTYLHFGNPPRPYFLDMDTGSDLTWLQCDAPCTSCVKGAHPLYKPLKANIIPPGDSHCVEVQRNQKANYCDSCHQCDYEIEYADHSSSMGVLARDELYLNIANGSLTNSKVAFGCAYDQQGLLLKTLGKTDGILGLSRAKISLPSQLASQQIIKNVLGHCLSTETTGGGYMFLGDDFVPYGQMTWVPMLHTTSTNSYQAEMVKVVYGDRQIRLGDAANGKGRIIFDTGSSYSYFPGQAYDDLVTTLNDVSSESLVRDVSDTSLPICWKPKSPLRSFKDAKKWFKPLNLQFRGKWWFSYTKLQIPPEGYLVMNSKGNVCLGILNGAKVYDGSTFILGDISLRGLMFVYDNVNEKIGWVRSDCDRPSRFESHSLY